MCIPNLKVGDRVRVTVGDMVYEGTITLVVADYIVLADRHNFRLDHLHTTVEKIEADGDVYP